MADDDDTVRDLVSFKLNAAGYRAITADNGSTALDLVHREHPDMVILDVAMPGLDGRPTSITPVAELPSLPSVGQPAAAITGLLGRGIDRVGDTR